MSDKSVHGRSGAAFTKDREKWLSPKGTQKRTTTLNRFQYLVQRKHLFLHPSFGQCVFHCRCLITFFSSSSLLSSAVCSIRMEGRMKKKTVFHSIFILDVKLFIVYEVRTTRSNALFSYWLFRRWLLWMLLLCAPNIFDSKTFMFIS